MTNLTTIKINILLVKKMKRPLSNMGLDNISISTRIKLERELVSNFIFNLPKPENIR